MRSFAFAAMLTLVASASGCIDYHSPAGVCDGVTCSGHGQCLAATGQATCVCDPGHQPDPIDPLACVPADDGPVIVDIVTGIEDPAGGTIAIHLRDHADVNLAEGDIHLMFLQTSQEYGTPVYLEIDVATRAIQEVLVPYDSPVANLREQADRVEVELIWSAAIHVLMRDQPGFEDMLAELQASLDDGSNRLVTETRDSHEIIDVRLPLEP